MPIVEWTGTLPIPDVSSITAFLAAMKPILLPIRFPRSPSSRNAIMIVALTIGIGGCAAKGATLGDEIGAAGDEYAGIAERWDNAAEKVAKGRKLQQRGRDRVRDGEDDIERAARLVKEGEREMARSERDYERLKVRSGVSVGPAPGT